MNHDLTSHERTAPPWTRERDERHGSSARMAEPFSAPCGANEIACRRVGSYWSEGSGVGLTQRARATSPLFAACDSRKWQDLRATV